MCVKGSNETLKNFRFDIREFQESPGRTRGGLQPLFPGTDC